MLAPITRQCRYELKKQKIDGPYIFYNIFYKLNTISYSNSTIFYYHLVPTEIFRRDHERSSFQKLAVNKWICRKNYDYFHDYFSSLAINSNIVFNIKEKNIPFVEITSHFCMMSYSLGIYTGLYQNF